MDWIRRWDRFDELDSTSSHLARIWRSGELPADQTPLVVTTKSQTAGRGRGDHLWFSDTGSLTFTLGLRPAELGLSLPEVVPIGLLTACTIIQAVEQLWPSIAGALGVRWPNDIECDRGKIAGILPECIIKDGNDLLLLVGVGVNITTNLANGPRDAKAIGTAIADLVGPYDVVANPAEALLQAFLQKLRPNLHQLSDPSNQWIADARRHDRLLGQQVQARQGDELISGTGVGWDTQGRLLVQQPCGTVARISSGQILRASAGN